MQATQLVADAVRDAARRAAAEPRSPGRAFAAALPATLDALAPGARPKAALARREDHLELRWPRATVAVHVVAGHEEITLSVLAWLAARGAQRIADGDADGVLLVAAAPDAQWSAGRPGTALLTGARTWTTSDLRDHTHRHHRAWSPDAHPPAHVPAILRTTPVLRVPAGPGWQAAAARVAPASTHEFRWPPLTTGDAAGLRRVA